MTTSIAQGKAAPLEDFAINVDALTTALKRISRKPAAKGKERYVYFSAGENAVRVHSRTGRIVGKQVYDVVQSAAAPKKRQSPMEGGVSLNDFPVADDDPAELRGEISASLQPKEAARRLGVTPATINNYRNAGKLLGLKQANRYVYPAWQFEAQSGQPIHGLEPVLAVLFTISESPSEVLALLTAQRDFFGGRSLKDLLLDGKMEEAIRGAEQSAMRG